MGRRFIPFGSFVWSESKSDLSFLDSRSCSFVVYRCHLYGNRNSRWYQCDVEDFKLFFTYAVRRHDVSYIEVRLNFGSDDQEKWIYRRGWWYHMVVD